MAREMVSLPPVKRLEKEQLMRVQLAELFSCSLLACNSTQTSSKTPTKMQGDRFIPNRGAMDIDIAHFNLMRDSKENAISNLKVVSPLKEEYKKKLAENLFQSAGSLDSPKILNFKNQSLPAGLDLSKRRLLYSDPLAASLDLTRVRHIPATPDRILDAPEIVDDYYLNLLDWSSKNVVAVALGTTVYLWHAETGAIEQLLKTTVVDDYISSISWAEDGRTIAVGFSNHEVQLWDICRACKLRKLGGHTARVSSLAWNGTTLSSGGRDSQIINHDVRERDSSSTFVGHSQEVCGLRWSMSGQQLASGGNDNLLHIWDAAVSTSTAEQSAPLFRLDSHQAAVKALAWCPYQNNLLASGGGTADRCIKFWNTKLGYCTKSIDTNSQVCALQWNRHQKELLSSHGFSQNQLCLWKYPSMVKIAELTGHTARVLHLSQSPDGTTVVSGADFSFRNAASTSARCGVVPLKFEDLYLFLPFMSRQCSYSDLIYFPKSFVKGPFFKLEKLLFSGGTSL